MLTSGELESAGHARWDWVYYVAAGVAISTPVGALTGEFPVAYVVAGFAALLVIFRGIWWGFPRGRVFLALGTLGLVASSVGVYGWILIQQATVARRTVSETDAATSVTEGQLLEAVWALEYFKTTRGHYPAQLEQLDAEIGKLGVGWDYTAIGHPDAHYFYYNLIDADHYVLRAHGPDAKPYTADDILPPIPEPEQARVGFRVSAP
jgi:hypothetical protein